MTWWQLLLALAGVWLYDWLTDRGVPADRLEWWHEERRLGREKLSQADQASPSRRHIPARAPGEPWERPAPATPDMASLGPACPVRFWDLTDDAAPAWLGESFDLVGVDAMLANLRADRVDVLS